MIKFEDKFVHFRWSDDLEGKEGFFGDSIQELEEQVAKDCSERIERSTCEKCFEAAHPFQKKSNKSAWNFFYYDPLFDIKKAYEEGKNIECKGPSDSEWIGLVNGLDVNEINWRPEALYHIIDSSNSSKETPLTNKELARWIAMGAGQVMSHLKYCGIVWSYYEGDDDEPVSDGYKVRFWNDPVWHKPTKEYCFPERNL